MAGNHCECFKATHDICETKIHREMQHCYFIPQENTDDYDQVNH